MYYKLPYVCFQRGQPQISPNSVSALWLRTEHRVTTSIRSFVINFLSAYLFFQLLPNIRLFCVCCGGVFVLIIALKHDKFDLIWYIRRKYNWLHDSVCPVDAWLNVRMSAENVQTVKVGFNWKLRPGCEPLNCMIEPHLKFYSWSCIKVLLFVNDVPPLLLPVLCLQNQRANMLWDAPRRCSD